MFSYKLCQVSKFSSSFVFDLGDQSTVLFTYNTNLIMKYKSVVGSDTRETDVTCQCSTGKESFTYIEENPKLTYVRSCHWCMKAE